MWVVGLVERSSGRIITYPVDSCDMDSIKTILKRQKEPGSSVFTDGFQTYNWLGDEGFQHFNLVQSTHTDSNKRIL